MKTKFGILFLSALTGAMLLFGTAFAEYKDVDAKALSAAKVSLQKGLTAAQAKGKPISGKYEMEDGKLQLSVYTASKGKYQEVIVDHATGKITKSEEIKDGDDLTHATEQTKAMAKAKTSLAAAVGKALAANKGYRAVSAMPSLDGDKPVASIVLQNGGGSKTVTQNLN